MRTARTVQDFDRRTSAFALAAAITAAIGLASVLTPPAATAEADVSVPHGRDTLPGDATPIAYAITIEPDLEARSFKGEATLDFSVVKNTDQIVVNAIDLDVASAILDGSHPARVETDANAQRMTFHFEQPIGTGRHTMAVAYTGKINAQAYGIFVSEYPTPDGPKTMMATQFEPGDARRLAPMWDEPALKAVFTISAIVPSGTDVISNTPAVKTSSIRGKSRIDFAPTPKMSSYLLFLGAGDLDRIAENFNGVEAGIVSRAGEAEKGRYALQSTRRILAEYNDYFGVDYPLAKLDQIAVPGAGGFGAMENWGAIMYFETRLLLDPALSGPREKQRIFEVIAHEVAHQWFGDLVTMSWWDDLWLNEGYASWMETKVASKLNPDWNVWLRALSGRERALKLDSVASSHPIVQVVRNIDEANLAFDPITYQKGEAVIRMIEAYLGEEAFRDGVRAYMKAHAYGNTVTNDLWKALESASTAPVRAIAADFTTQAGVPLIVVESVRCEGATTRVALHQSHFAADVSGKDPARRWRTPVTAIVVGTNQVSRAMVEGSDSQIITLTGCGPVKINVDETGYFRTLYGDEDFVALESSFDALSSSDQLGLINDAFALGASGDATLARFAELVERTPVDADPVILSSVADKLKVLADLFEGIDGQQVFNEFAHGWLKAVFSEVGWERAIGESDNRSILRADLIAVLARFNDPDVISEAKERFARFQEDPKSLPADLVETVIRTVGASADKKTFDTLIALARAATSPREARLYLHAAAGVRDAMLADEAAAAIFDRKTPGQLAPRLFGDLADAQPKFAWDYYRSHQMMIDALLDPLDRLDYPPSIARRSNDPRTADELEAFARDHLPASAASEVARAAQTIRWAATVRVQRLPDLVKHLNARSKS